MEAAKKAFRNALGGFATGVTVITTTDEEADNKPAGLTANSFTSLSLEPPLILWNLGKDAHCYKVFEKTKHFVVHVLHSGQQKISNHFASKNSNKFTDVEWSSGTHGSPILSDYAVCFECLTEAVYPGGDHLIIVGRVDSYRQLGSESPLLYYGGSYRSLANE